MKFVAELSNAPPVTIQCPDGKDKGTKQIQSVEGILNFLETVSGFRDQLYRSSSDEFKWISPILWKIVVILSSQFLLIDEWWFILFKAQWNWETTI